MKPDWCPKWAWDEAERITLGFSFDAVARSIFQERIARAILEAHQRGRRPYEEHLFAILDAQTPADQVQAIRAARAFKANLE